MENVTDETSNPFGMRPPCRWTPEDGPNAVHGYGDANADFHVIGDHPGVHGGTTTGVPFTGTAGARALQAVLHEVGFLTEPYSDEPTLDNCFWSYLHTCQVPPGETPSRDDYAELERFFDAELRAINAHVLLPVGERAIEYVLDEHTANPGRFDDDTAALHAQEIHGSGYLIVPVADPGTWVDTDAERLTERLREVTSRDYAQIADLGRYLATDEPYFVR